MRTGKTNSGAGFVVVVATLVVAMVGFIHYIEVLKGRENEGRYGRRNTRKNIPNDLEKNDNRRYPRNPENFPEP